MLVIDVLAHEARLAEELAWLGLGLGLGFGFGLGVGVGFGVGLLKPHLQKASCVSLHLPTYPCISP